MTVRNILWVFSFLIAMGFFGGLAALSFLFLGLSPQLFIFSILTLLVPITFIVFRKTRYGVFLSIFVLIGFGIIEIINLQMLNYDNQNSFYLQAEKNNIPFDTRPLWDVIAEERKTHPYTHPYILPDFFKKKHHRTGTDEATEANILPLGGVPLAHTVYCNESGKYAIYPSDRYGFNNDDSIYEQGVDILLVGDSMIQAGCVQKGEDVGSLLRKNGYKAASLGMANSDALLIYAKMREYAPAISPKVILWIGYEDDLGGLEMEYAHPILKKYADNPAFTQGLASSPEKVKEFLEGFSTKYELEERQSLLKKRIWNIVSLGYFRQIWGVTRAAGEKFDENVYQKDKEKISVTAKQTEIFKTLLRNASLFSKEHNLKIIYVLIPGSDLQNSKRYVFREMIEAEGIPFYDFGEIIQNLQDQLSIRSHPKAGHFSVKGHQIFNDYLLSVLKSHGFENMK